MVRRSKAFEILSVVTIKQPRDEKRLPEFSRTSSSLYVPRISSTRFYILLRYPSSSLFRRIFIRDDKINDEQRRDFEILSKDLERTLLDPSYIPFPPPSFPLEIKIETRNGCSVNVYGGSCSLAVNSSPRVNLTISSGAGVRVNDPYNRFFSSSIRTHRKKKKKEETSSTFTFDLYLN